MNPLHPTNRDHPDSRGDRAQFFGKLVRDRRKQERLSQTELADKVGISRNYLSQIERGESTNLSWQVRQTLSEALGLSSDRSEPAPAIADTLPPGLATFASQAQLPPDDVQMLAKLKYRGNQPSTPEKWELLYNVIKMTVDT
ncbi:MAG: helix-turn-helix transcriptional regulator [Synechococcales bacterium]|nr:helix-turn-helix transcriptional regulator [Synechococcales bacterium]